jgi:hypothetical protein
VKDAVKMRLIAFFELLITTLFSMPNLQDSMVLPSSSFFEEDFEWL